ncbi:hypothetical protein Y88_2286 [Novosphingobium nitrogenifigens DSM 19370]|uniref:Uncharacterized protein n=1 Tax=Novosphingobium nitrogenifigens DSM 19370 TaxID=983920 RepID=F1Z665_9SPHN|nr:hypothetical protein Y88_2286 [Novosphingobium nitrogenifigens DSM 19370]
MPRTRRNGLRRSPFLRRKTAGPLWYQRVGLMCFDPHRLDERDAAGGNSPNLIHNRRPQGFSALSPRHGSLDDGARIKANRFGAGRPFGAICVT